MASSAATVTLTVVGGPTIIVPWTSGMNAQQAMERAFLQQLPVGEFTYALQYYGSPLGYLVVMINETFESFISSADPFYFWEFLVTGKPSKTGIDTTLLQAGDTISFELQAYSPQAHSGSTLKAKYESRFRAKTR
jgi:hypothetical protein